MDDDADDADDNDDDEEEDAKVQESFEGNGTDICRQEVSTEKGARKMRYLDSLWGNQLSRTFFNSWFAESGKPAAVAGGGGGGGAGGPLSSG